MALSCLSPFFHAQITSGRQTKEKSRLSAFLQVAIYLKSIVRQFSRNLCQPPEKSLSEPQRQ